MKKISLILLATVLCIIVNAQSNWSLDKNHGKLGFSIVHMKISHVEGDFKEFDVNMVASKDDFTDAIIEMTANVKSINTDNSMRDKDLQSANYFDAEKYPTLTFKSTSFVKIKGDKYKLKGNLTIHGVTKPMVFDVVYNGTITDPYSKKQRAGFTISGKLNRIDFGVGTPEMLLSQDVDLMSNVEFIKN